ncbi:hypothetical protein [Aureimonas sp. ME7]|uniref:hypothetical protein n=1 Tax=Aureimonas sp. ME7 TaxID=2744252 RepID=UPI0015F49D70|nr:hypothetical protein [Aureimonas sp. ME7]
MTSSTIRWIPVAFLVLALGACNGSAGNKSGSGDGPTQGAGSSNQPATATNGQPAAE